MTLNILKRVIVSMLFLGTVISSSSDCSHGKIIEVNAKNHRLCVPENTQMDCSNNYLERCQSLKQIHRISLCFEKEFCLQKRAGEYCMYDVECGSLNCINNICGKTKTRLLR